MDQSRRNSTQFLFLLWAIVIIAVYYVYHPDYLICNELPLGPCIDKYGWWLTIKSVLVPKSSYFAHIVLVSYIAVILWRNRKEITIRCTAFQAILVAFAAGVFALTALIFFMPNMSYAQAGISFIPMLTSIVAKWGSVALGIVMLVGLGAGIGRFVLRKFRLEPDTIYEQFLVSVGVGWMVLIYAYFLLLAIGFFATLPVLGITAALMIMARKELMWAAYVILKHRASWTVSLVSIEVSAVVLSAIILGYTLIEVLVPFPFMWDGIYRYANTPNLIAAGGNFITGVFPYPFEILMALGRLFTDSMMFGIVLAWFSAIFAGLVLFALIRKKASRPASFLAVLAYFSMPIVYFIMSVMVKVDFAGLTYVLFSMLAFLYWLSSHNWRWLMLSGLFLGMAISIKLSIAFFGVGFVMMACLAVAKRAVITLREKIATVLLLMFCIALPLVPWVIKNLIEAQGKVSVHALLQGGNSGPSLGVCSLGDEERYLGTAAGDTPEIQFTAPREEVGRYWGYAPRTIFSYLLLPWHITMNPTINSWLIHIGPLLLVFLPLVLGVRRRSDVSGDEQYLPLFGIAIASSFVVWAVFGHAVTWYVMPTLMLYGVFVVRLCEKRYHAGVWKRVMVAATLMCIAVTFLFRIDNPTMDIKYQYVGGALSERDLRYQYPAHLQVLADILNADAPTATEPKYILDTATLVNYRIHRNDTRVYIDQVFDTMNCVLALNGDDVAATTEYLKKHRFKYIAFNPDGAFQDVTPEQTLAAKLRRVSAYIAAAAQSGRLKSIYGVTNQQDNFLAFEIL